MAREDQDARVEYRGTGFYVGLAAILLFAIALFVLAVQNTQEVDVDFLGFQFTMPLFAVAIGAALIAVILDELIGLLWRRQRRARLEEHAELTRLRAAEARVAETEHEEPVIEVPEERREDETVSGSRDQSDG